MCGCPKKAKVREHLQHLKETDPEKYHQAVSALKERQQRRLEWLKENRTEAYQKLVGNKPWFLQFIKQSPLKGLELRFQRDRSPARRVDV